MWAEGGSFRRRRPAALISKVISMLMLTGTSTVGAVLPRASYARVPGVVKPGTNTLNPRPTFGVTVEREENQSENNPPASWAPPPRSPGPDLEGSPNLGLEALSLIFSGSSRGDAADAALVFADAQKILRKRGQQEEAGAAQAGTAQDGNSRQTTGGRAVGPGGVPMSGPPTCVRSPGFKEADYGGGSSAQASTPGPGEYSSSDSSTMTDGIEVHASSWYSNSLSDPSDGVFAFSYRVRFTNRSPHPVRLMSRHWEITVLGDTPDRKGRGKKKKGIEDPLSASAAGEEEDSTHLDVKGYGVCGEMPVIPPGQSFEYTSWMPLNLQHLRKDRVAARLQGTYSLQVLPEDYNSPGPPLGGLGGVFHGETLQVSAKVAPLSLVIPSGVPPPSRAAGAMREAQRLARSHARPEHFAAKRPCGMRGASAAAAAGGGEGWRGSDPRALVTALKTSLPYPFLL